MRKSVRDTCEKLAKKQVDQDKFNREILEKLENPVKLLERLDSIQNELKEVKEKVLEPPVKKIIHAPEVQQKKQQNAGTVKPCKFIVRNVFKDVSRMEKEKSYHSDNEEYFGVPWHLSIKHKEDHLATYLYCGKSDNDGKWFIETEYELKIIHPSGKSVTEYEEYIFAESCGYGYSDFMKWEDMMNDYSVDDKLIMEAHVDIDEISGIYKENLRSFDESTEKFSDVVLNVKDEKFYVLRRYLAAHSTYFEALFLGNFNESEKGEVILSGIDPYDFQKYLEVLYGENAINEATVEGILLLGDMYDTPIVVRKCEEFLLKESKKTLKKKFQLYNRYNLEKLKEKCLSEIKTTAHIRSVIPGNVKDTDPSIMADLFEKSLSF